MGKEQEVKQRQYDSLKELGLSEQEIKLYVISLALGPSPITKVALNMGISRPNVYKVIKSLINQGLVRAEMQEKYSRNFSVEPPTVVLNKLREKRETLSRIDISLTDSIPNLLSLYQQGGRTTQIKILQGKDQYIKAFAK